MYHLRFKGSHYDIGLKRGAIFKKLNVKFPIYLDDFQKDFGRKSGKILQEYFPQVCEEVRGITDAAKMDYEEFCLG